MVVDSENPRAHPLGLCTGVFSNTMGLPCCHQIDELKRSGQVLEPRDLHSYWQYSKPDSVTNSILESEDIL